MVRGDQLARPQGFNTSTHRPDLIGVPGQGQVAIEVELAKKSAERLQSILALHARCARPDGPAA